MDENIFGRAKENNLQKSTTMKEYKLNAAQIERIYQKVAQDFQEPYDYEDVELDDVREDIGWYAVGTTQEPVYVSYFDCFELEPNIYLCDFTVYKRCGGIDFDVEDCVLIESADGHYYVSLSEQSIDELYIALEDI